MKKIKSIKLFIYITAIIGFLLTIYWLRKTYKEKELSMFIAGIGKLDAGEGPVVSISNKTDRYIVKKSENVSDVFVESMSSEGWQYVGDFGRCILLEKEHEEMLVKRTTVFKKYCIFEFLNKDYLEQGKAV